MRLGYHRRVQKARIRRRQRRTQVVPILTSSVPDRPKVEGEPFMMGYARVSMRDQSLQRQVDELVAAGVAAVDIFSDTGTGANMDRPGWDLCTKKLQPGDVLVIHSLDRLSRDLVHTMTTLNRLNDLGIRVKVLTMDFDSATPMGRFVFAQMAAFAQFEREIINERTAHGLAKARERGRIGGTKLRYTDEIIGEAVAKAKNYETAAKKLGCSLITVKRGMARIRAKSDEKKEEQAA